MYWGTVLEEIVAKHYQKRTGYKVRRVNAVLQHPDYSFMLANLDREVIGTNEVQLLECKTTGAYGAKLWAEGVPEYVQVQVQHQLAVTGRQSADVAVLVGGQEFRIYNIQRDEALIRHLIALEAEFWCYVEEDIPPPADGSESAQKALQTLYPMDFGQTLDFKAVHELSDLFAELVQVRSQLDDIEAKEQWLKQRLQSHIGDAARADFATGHITWKRSKDTWQLDTKRLLKDHPELLDQYGVLRAGSRRFLVSVD
jgi:predicted phage-related endonuclease